MSQTAVIVLLLMACPVGMGLMVWHMGRYQQHNLRKVQPPKPAMSPEDQAAEMVRLQAENDQLKAAQGTAAPRGRDHRLRNPAPKRPNGS